MSRDIILIEDKRFDIKHLPKNVLKGLPDLYKSNAKVYRILFLLSFY
jgi:hypothetical protein